MLKIPTRYYGKGNLAAAASLKGFGRKLLGDLQRDLSFQDLPTGESVEKMLDGTTIRCVVNYGITEVHIDVPHGGPIPEENLIDECFCNCSFAIGFIVSESEGTPDWPNENRRYDVAVCNKKDKYVLFRYCLPSDHLNWEEEAANYEMESIEGMPVVVFLDNARTDAHLCCIYETSGLVQNIEQTACSPLIPEEAPETPETDPPVYRIVPVFPAIIRKWDEVEYIIGAEEKRQHGLLQT